jgi:hypothetical protein
VRAASGSYRAGSSDGYGRRAIRAVHVEQADGRLTLDASHVVLAAGPMQTELTRMTGIELPITAEPHFKVGFADTLGALPRHAPMLIWLDEQHLPWTAQERAALAEDEDARWLLAPFPAGVHGRPDGGSATLILFNYEKIEAAEPVFPLPEPAHYAEIAIRGMSTAVPGLKAYGGEVHRPYVDGGYYMRTQETGPHRASPAGGRVCLVRLLGIRHHGVMRGRRTHRPPHRRGRTSGLRAGLPAVALRRSRLSRPARRMGDDGQLCRRRSALTSRSLELDGSGVQQVLGEAAALDDREEVLALSRQEREVRQRVAATMTRSA